MTENRTLHKSDNQGGKEEICIQTGREVERGSWGREDAQQSGGWRTWVDEEMLAERALPHLHADKLEGTTGEQDRPLNTGFQC